MQLPWWQNRPSQTVPYDCLFLWLLLSILVLFGCRDGGNMVTDQKLKVNPSARLQELNLAALAPTNAAEFRHPLTLLRLAHFVRDATKVRPWLHVLPYGNPLKSALTSAAFAPHVGVPYPLCMYIHAR